VTDQPPSAASRSSFIEIEFICTNRRKHRPYSLLKAMVGPGPDDFDELTDYTAYRRADRVSMFGAESAYDESDCPGCGRNPRMMHEKFVKLRQGLHREGITRFDLSKLDF
jgi:hypothetical protein